MINPHKLFSTTFMLSMSCLFVSPEPVSCAPVAWRSFVRNARINLGNREYKKAISVYSEAIGMLDKSNPEAEAKYDLYLNLAEAYRLNNQLVEAEAVLQKVEPIILHRRWIDPLIQVRYWRRRASLYESQKLFHQCGQAYLKATRILRQFLPQCGARELIGPLITMIKARQWTMSSALIHEMRSYPVLDKRTRLVVEEAIHTTSLQLRSEVDHAIRTGNLREAQEILVELTEFDTEPKTLLNWWIALLSSPNATTITPLLKEKADSLLAKCRKLRLPESSSEHVLRGKLLERSHRLLEAELEFEKACLLAAEHGDAAEKSVAYAALTDAVSSFEQLRPASIKLLLEEQKLTSSQYEYLWKYAGLKRFNLHHVRVNLRLATEYARDGQITAAQNTLAGISSVRVKDFPFFDLKVLTPQLEICRALIRAGEHKQAALLYSRLAPNVAAQLRQAKRSPEASVDPFVVRLAWLSEQTRSELSAIDPRRERKKCK